MHVDGVLRTKGSGVVTISPDARLHDAIRQLRDHHIGALVVTATTGSVAGIVSERDVVRALADDGPSALDRPVSSLMSTGVVTCSPTDTIEQLMAAMTERRIRHLPVVADGELVGIISIGDVVKRRVIEMADEAQALQDYITQGR